MKRNGYDEEAMNGLVFAFAFLFAAMLLSIALGAVA